MPGKPVQHPLVPPFLAWLASEGVSRSTQAQYSATVNSILARVENAYEPEQLQAAISHLSLNSQVVAASAWRKFRTFLEATYPGQPIPPDMPGAGKPRERQRQGPANGPSSILGGGDDFRPMTHRVLQALSHLGLYQPPWTPAKLVTFRWEQVSYLGRPWHPEIIAALTEWTFGRSMLLPEIPFPARPILTTKVGGAVAYPVKAMEEQLAQWHRDQLVQLEQQQTQEEPQEEPPAYQPGEEPLDLLPRVAPVLGQPLR